jgi:enhancing lycopene biosynthesis protein 2
MAKRVGVLLSGCGRLDGSDISESILTLLVIERAGAQAICAAPDADQAAVVDHVSGERAESGARNAWSEAARLGGAQVRPLSALSVDAIDALIVPGGEGPIATLSDYLAKHALCQVHPDLAQLLRAMLQTRRPMGFFGLSALLAARVLGPAAGVRVTVGQKGTPAAKHAAVMGADVRPCAPEDVIVDQKARVYSTPGFLSEGARLPGVARAVDRLVRAVVANARDRAPSVPAPPPDEFDVTGVSTDRGRGSA